MEGHELDLPGSQSKPVAECCEYWNVQSASIKSEIWEFSGLSGKMLVFKAGFSSMKFIIYHDVQLNVNVINQMRNILIS
jgi:hypothetical protein